MMSSGDVEEFWARFGNSGLSGGVGAEEVGGSFGSDAVCADALRSGGVVGCVGACELGGACVGGLPGDVPGRTGCAIVGGDG